MLMNLTIFLPNYCLKRTTFYAKNVIQVIIVVGTGIWVYPSTSPEYTLIEKK